MSARHFSSGTAATGPLRLDGEKTVDFRSAVVYTKKKQVDMCDAAPGRGLHESPYRESGTV